MGALIGQSPVENLIRSNGVLADERSARGEDTNLFREP